MKNQIEDAEHERNSAIKINKNLEEESFELQDKLNEVTQIKIIIDRKYSETSRGNVSLAAMVNDYEEEAIVSALSSQQMTVQAQSVTI